MFYVVAIAVLLLSARLAVKYKRNILDSMAVCTAGLILVLYVLAFFRALRAVAVIAIAAIIWTLVRTVFDDRTQETGARTGQASSGFLNLAKELSDPMVILFILTVAGVTAATSSQVFTWWDDINFWSSDAKQIYYMGGFPGKYGNVSPEFGDYPPVTSLFKWLFLSLSASQYRESLQFAGYFALNLVFLLPLLARIKSYIDASAPVCMMKIGLCVISFAAIALLPGVFNGIIYYGTPADVTMAILYGSLLLAIYDQYDCSDLFYFGRIGLYASVLLLSKSVAFEWTIFALIFYILIGKRNYRIWFSILTAAASYGSWLGFCLINRRVAKLTGASIRMATSGTYVTPDNTMEKLGFFMQGFWFEPMHSDHNPLIDLSTGAAVLLIALGIFLLYYRNILGKSEARKIALFTLITGLVSYGIVFLAHISIFQAEDQYLDAYAMGISIARYCAPFTLGTCILLLGILFNRLRARSGKKRRELAVLVLAAAVLLTADYSGVYKHLVGYRDSISQNQASYDDMVGDAGRAIAAAVSDPMYWGKRVLVLQDGHKSHWVHNAYINKETSPVPLVYDNYIIDDDDPDSIRAKIDASHATYLLVEDESGAARELFSRIIKEEYEAGKVYRIDGNLY